MKKYKRLFFLAMSMAAMGAGPGNAATVSVAGAAGRTNNNASVSRTIIPIGSYIKNRVNNGTPSGGGTPSVTDSRNALNELRSQYDNVDDRVSLIESGQVGDYSLGSLATNDGLASYVTAALGGYPTAAEMDAAIASAMEGVTMPDISGKADVSALGTAAYEDSAAFATAEQGALAASAVQPADLSGYLTSALQSDDNISELNNDSGYVTAGELAAALTDYATGQAVDGIASRVDALETDLAATISNLISQGAITIPAVDISGKANTADLGTAAYEDAAAFATAAQGTKADTSLQPGANISGLANDAGYITSADLGSYATAAQGAKAETAVQPEDLSGYATTAALGTAAFTESSAYATAADGALAATAVQPADLSGYATTAAIAALEARIAALEGGDGGGEDEVNPRTWLDEWIDAPDGPLENSSRVYDENANTWSVTANQGSTGTQTASGDSLCSETEGAFAGKGNPSLTSGQYCWCRMTSPRVGAWVLADDALNDCETECANTCADDIREDDDIRAAVLSLP